jgi:hypothetical protein
MPSDLATIAALCLAAVLARAAWGKARAVSATAAAADALGVPRRWSRPVARLLPPLELSAGVLLVVAPRAGAVITTALLGGFTVAVIRVVSRDDGEPVRCACFGAGSEPIGAQTIVRNALLLAAAAWVLFSAQAMHRVPPLASVITATATGVIAMVSMQLAAMRTQVGAIWSIAAARPDQEPS